ncbi:DnaJ family domain-containing protein [Ornithinimicrobium avium]|uniref:DUF1992 domain-containing protein n=1 Tax=Ornithinimicrobium avium TaxID=2283195 RepID=A0A345NJZ5_9MICO|nr:DUF1992 domain-containing protein [Ornithinimicrobium avium]AXH95353.1 DUF1992 domain-containing protein [Ornithinimicrobium avium]
MTEDEGRDERRDQGRPTWGRPGQRPGAPDAEEQLAELGIGPQPRRRMTPEGIQSWVDRSIAQAERQGAFADLPGAGRPLRDVDITTDPDWWVRGLIEREQLDLSDALPGVLQLRREKAGLPGSLAGLAEEAAVRARLEDFNERVLADRRRPYAGAGSPPVVGRVDVEEMVLAWRRLRDERVGDGDGSAGAEERPGPGGAAGKRRGRWWRRGRSSA